MISGAHFLLYSKDAAADRAFFRDVLGFPHVDVGGGWLIFAMPAAEAAIHPLDGESSQSPDGHRMLGAVLYLMCDDLNTLITSLKKKNAQCTELEQARWGVSTTIPLPSGGAIGLYQPSHPTALSLNAERSSTRRAPKKLKLKPSSSRLNPASKKRSSSRRSSSKRSSKRR
jgi:hypothetical protein